MKDLKSIATPLLHSRMAKTLKKSLKYANVEITQSQASEAVANVLGFSSYHAANSFYSKESSSESVTEANNSYMVSYTCKSQSIFDEVGETNKKNVLFKGFASQYFNFFELSRIIDLFDLNLSKTANAKFEDFLNETVNMVDEELREDFRNIMPYEIFAHDEYELIFKKIFNSDQQDKIIKLFDDIFQEYLQNEELLVICSEDTKILKSYSQLKITPLTKDEVSFIEKNEFADLVIENNR